MSRSLLQAEIGVVQEKGLRSMVSSVVSRGIEAPDGQCRREGAGRKVVVRSKSKEMKRKTDRPA